MEQNKNLNTAIKNNDVIACRAVILANFRKDRSSIEFQNVELAKYAKTELNNLGSQFFKGDDGESEFTEDKSCWNVELWESMRIELDYNFSEKKFNNIIHIMKHLRETGISDFQVKDEAVTSTNTKKNVSSNTDQETQQDLKQMIIVATVGAVVGGVMGGVVGRPIIGGMLGAGIGYAINKKYNE